MNAERARTVLSEKRDRLDEVARRARDRAPQPAAEPGGVLDVHPTDDASEVETRLEDHGLADDAERRRAAVDAALERIDAGTWGTCTVCGRAVDDERLEALPETDRCRDHA